MAGRRTMMFFIFDYFVSKKLSKTLNTCTDNYEVTQPIFLQVTYFWYTRYFQLIDTLMIKFKKVQSVDCRLSRWKNLHDLN